MKPDDDNRDVCGIDTALSPKQAHVNDTALCALRRLSSEPPDTTSWLKMYQKCFCGQSSAPHLLGELTAPPLTPLGGAHNAYPDPIAGGFRGCFTMGRGVSKKSK